VKLVLIQLKLELHSSAICWQLRYSSCSLETHRKVSSVQSTMTFMDCELSWVGRWVTFSKRYLGTEVWMMMMDELTDVAYSPKTARTRNKKTNFTKTTSAMMAHAQKRHIHGAIVQMGSIYTEQC